MYQFTLLANKFTFTIYETIFQKDFTENLKHENSLNSNIHFNHSFQL